MSKVVVMNEASRLIQVGACAGGKDVVAHEALDLKPGRNTVALSDWEAVKRLPVIRTLLSEKKLVEGKSSSKDLDNLKELRPGEAVKAVTETFDIRRLRGWRDGEDRSPVVKALDDQIRMIQADPSKAKRVEDNQAEQE